MAWKCSFRVRPGARQVTSCKNMKPIQAGSAFLLVPSKNTSICVYYICIYVYIFMLMYGVASMCLCAAPCMGAQERNLPARASIPCRSPHPRWERWRPRSPSSSRCSTTPSSAETSRLRFRLRVSFCTPPPPLSRPSPKKKQGLRRRSGLKTPNPRLGLQQGLSKNWDVDPQNGGVPCFFLVGGLWFDPSL